MAGSRLVAAWLRVGGPAAGEGALEAAQLGEVLVAQRERMMGVQPMQE